MVRPKRRFVRNLISAAAWQALLLVLVAYLGLFLPLVILTNVQFPSWLPSDLALSAWVLGGIATFTILIFRGLRRLNLESLRGKTDWAWVVTALVGAFTITTSLVTLLSTFSNITRSSCVEPNSTVTFSNCQVIQTAPVGGAVSLIIDQVVRLVLAYFIAFAMLTVVFYAVYGQTKRASSTST